MLLWAGKSRKLGSGLRSPGCIGICQVSLGIC